MKLRKHRLEDVCTLQIGKTPRREIKDYWGKGYSWVSISDMKSPVIDSTKEEITEKAVKECGCKLIPEGAILLSFKLSIGKLAYAGKELFTNEAIVALGIKDNRTLNKDYLYYVLKNIPLIGSNKAVMGSTLNKESLRILSLPIPEDISDQLHIANVLTKAENLISQRKASIRLLDEYLKSTFLEMFGDPVRNEKGWEKVKLSDVCLKIGSGATPRGGKESYQKVGISLIRSLNVHNDEFFYKDLALIDDRQADELKNVILEPNDVLLNITGASVARCCVVPKDILPGRVNQHVSILRPFNKVLNPIFLSRMFTNETFQSYLIKRSKTKGATREAITKEEIEKMVVPVPTIVLQIHFAQIVEKTEALKTQYQKSLKELENLYGCLSQKAFRGELSFNDEMLMMVAEPEVSYRVNNSSIPEIKRGFAKQVLGGKIVSLFKDDKNFTHIKFQKIQYLAEHFAGEDLLWNYYRQSAGPYDNKFMHNVSDRLKQNKWFEEKQFRFYPLGKVEEIDRYYEKYFGNKKEKLSKLFSLLINSTERLCEVVATIYAVWNNHIILKQEFNHEGIKQDFFKWSNRKANLFSEADFEKALEWMQKHEIVPTGFGHLIKETKKLR